MKRKKVLIAADDAVIIRVGEIAQWVEANNATLRGAAAHFGVSFNTIFRALRDAGYEQRWVKGRGGTQ